MILALVEQEDGRLADGAAGVLAVARVLSGARNAPVAAVAAVAVGDLGDLPAQLGGHGVGRLYLLRHPRLDGGSPQPRGDALAQLVDAVGADAVLAADTVAGTEVLARAAARAGLPLATHCTALRPGPPWALTRERGGGSLLEDAELDAPVALCTVTPGAGAGASPAPARCDVAVSEFVPDLDDADRCTRVVDRQRRASGVGLASAPAVVSGGRGVGSAEGYAVLEELAALLGGAVGCSRVATNNGWRPHSDQVGLTGTRISPDLYVACGISGATQHWVGCMNARTILAINTDPEAPMVTRATYAVIGDVHEVLPAVLAELRARAGAREPSPVPRPRSAAPPLLEERRAGLLPVGDQAGEERR